MRFLELPQRTIELSDYCHVAPVDAFVAYIGGINFGLRLDESVLRSGQLGQLWGVNIIESSYVDPSKVWVIRP